MQLGGAQVLLGGRVERRQLADDPREDVIGESRVAGEHRAVHVRADQALAHEPLGVATAAVAGEHSSERPLGRPERGASTVVLEAGEHGERRVGLDDELADEPVGPGASDGVDQPEAVDHRAVGGLVAVADELEPGAHREHGRAAGAPAVDRGPRAPHARRRHDLRVVLPAAEQVDVERIRDGRARGDLDQLGGVAAPPQPLDQHHGVAAVAVRPEQLGIHQADADRGLGRCAHPNLR